MIIHLMSNLSVYSVYLKFFFVVFFFFSSRRRHTRCSRDWSSDVCSSDLGKETNRLAIFDGLRVAAADFLLLNLAAVHAQGEQLPVGAAAEEHGRLPRDEIGRASCRERV